LILVPGCATDTEKTTARTRLGFRCWRAFHCDHVLLCLFLVSISSGACRQGPGTTQGRRPGSRRPARRRRCRGPCCAASCGVPRPSAARGAPGPTTASPAPGRRTRRRRGPPPTTGSTGSRPRCRRACHYRPADCSITAECQSDELRFTEPVKTESFEAWDSGVRK
jgi:hypothetical protein